MADQALDSLKVLDLGWHIAGPYCTKLLADYGAEVIKVERPDGGDPARKVGPFPNDKPDPEASGFFFYLNNNKKSITLDLKTDSGIRDLKELIKWADILVENFKGGPVGVDSLAVALHESTRTIEEVYEPYLIKEGFLQRTPRGRVALDKTYAYLNLESLQPAREQTKLF